jgi:hypothetical protein
MQRGRFWSAIGDGDLNHRVVRGGLGKLDKYVVIAVLVKNAGVEQLILVLFAAARGCFARDRRTGTQPVGTFRDTSCASAPACCRRKSSTP